MEWDTGRWIYIDIHLPVPHSKHPKGYMKNQFLAMVKKETIRAQESMERKYREVAFKKLLADIRKTAKKGYCSYNF